MSKNYERMMSVAKKGAVLQAYYSGGWATVTDPDNPVWAQYELRIAPYYAALEYGDWSSALREFVITKVHNNRSAIAAKEAIQSLAGASSWDADNDEWGMFYLFFAEDLADQGR